jgi:hypothetical protein
MEIRELQEAWQISLYKNTYLPSNENVLLIDALEGF